MRQNKFGSRCVARSGSYSPETGHEVLCVHKPIGEKGWRRRPACATSSLETDVVSLVAPREFQGKKRAATWSRVIQFRAAR